MIVEIGPLEQNGPKIITCTHSRCDGRPAKWDLPQSLKVLGKRQYSCSVHLPRFCELILAKLGLDTIGLGRRHAKQ